MKILNPNDHPVIKKIMTCSFITNKIKSEACNEITKMIMSEKYGKANHGRYYWNLESFMNEEQLGSLFSWHFNHLGHDYWRDISDKLEHEKRQHENS